MGLDTSHDCFHGPYSQFMRWRIFIAKQVGIPLEAMESYIERYVSSEEVSQISGMLKGLGPAKQWEEPLYSGMTVLRAMQDVAGIPWSIVANDPLTKLLNHSDCGGRIRWWDAKPIALRLLQILRKIENDTNPEMPARGTYDGMYPATKRFALGLLRSYKSREDVRFR